METGDVKGLRVGILGATGMVGQEMLRVLLRRKFPASAIVLLASSRTAGTTVSCEGREFPVTEATPASFEGLDVVLASAGEAASMEMAPHIRAAGAVLVDNSAAFRMDPEVPLVVPEINAHALDAHTGIVANPNCSTAIMLMAVNPLRELATIERIVVSSYQSVSGAGKEAVDELEAQTRARLAGVGEPAPKAIAKPIAFNLVPQIGSIGADGYSSEETKFANETRKILEDDAIRVTATAVRVPVAVGHSEAINIEFDRPVGVDAVREAIRRAPMVELMDDAASGVYPMPREVAGQDPVYVGRIRQDLSHPNAVNLWVVGDNLLRGAALNAVLIAEALLARGQLRSDRKPQVASA